MIKSADYVLDLGPEGGDRGGLLIARGTPEEVAEDPGSYTGQYLKETLHRQYREAELPAEPEADKEGNTTDE